MVNLSLSHIRIEILFFFILSKYFLCYTNNSKVCDKVKKFLMAIFLFVVLLIPSKTFALNEVNIYFFHSESCNYCNQEKAYLEALKERYFNIRVYYYDISTDTNYNLMKQAKELYGVEESGIPFTIIGDSTFVGFSQSKKCTMEEKIYEYSYNAYKNRFGTEILTISYRTDLEGDIQKHYDESDYVIEESGTVSEDATEENNSTSIWDNNKYKFSIILISIGLGLAIVVVILGLIERKRRI